jgi:hypothetical protein
MREQIVVDTVIDVVPQWYQAARGMYPYTLEFNGQAFHFFCYHPLPPRLNQLLEFARARLATWAEQLPPYPTPSATNKIREDMALHWLAGQDAAVQWNKLIAYTEGLLFRTYENQPVTLNLVIGAGQGTTDITDPLLQGILDPLAATDHTYLRVDKELRFLDYQQILWSDVRETDEYKFNPEFLQPFASILKPGEYSLHITRLQDIVILDSTGLLAACRRGQWYVYDIATLRHSMEDIMGAYRVECNLFEVIFDLSYGRHGALLVFDPDHRVIEHVVNRSAVIGGPNPEPDPARGLLAGAIRAIQMGAAGHRERKKRLFLEVANVDGAVIFDAREVLAFGAMIES